MKDKILHRLKTGVTGFISGEELSELLGVTRTAVWKHIRELKQEGYDIRSSPKKGYRLTQAPDVFNAREIGYELGTEVLGTNIVYLEAVDSTNTYAKKLAGEGCIEGTVVVADVQTAGKGRLGRTWCSAAGKGVWMSVV